MTRPHPVVGVTSEFADCRRWSAHEADIGELPVHEEEILVAVVEALDNGLQSLFRVGSLKGDGFGVFGHKGGPLVFRHRRVIALENGGGDVLHPVEEPYENPLVGELLFPGHCPESVPEVVMLDAAVLLDAVIAAMVVGQEQSVRGDEFSGTASVKKDHGVFERCLIDAVDVFGLKPETFVLHVDDALLDKGRKPHSLVRVEGQDRRQGGEDGE